MARIDSQLMMNPLVIEYTVSLKPSSFLESFLESVIKVMGEKWASEVILSVTISVVVPG
jgi:hypothetical protein